MLKNNSKVFPAQTQKRKPGIQKLMVPQPLTNGEWYKGSGKLKDKVAIITGGDSGIGRSVAIFFAREGADYVFLAAQDSSYITGQVIHPNGGDPVTS